LCVGIKFVFEWAQINTEAKKDCSHRFCLLFGVAIGMPYALVHPVDYKKGINFLTGQYLGGADTEITVRFRDGLVWTL